MPLNQHGFSLTEVLIAMAISSLLLLSTSRFLPGLQRAVLLQTGQQELEEELWQRLYALGKQLQRAGYCAGECQGQALSIARQGSCVIVQWDANSNGEWDVSSSDSDATGFRLESGALETLHGAASCEGKGWVKLTDPDSMRVDSFSVTRAERQSMAPELSIALSASRKERPGKVVIARYTVTGFNL